MSPDALLPPLLALGLAPLLLGIINRTKAVVAGRVGAPLLQPYHDLAKLMRKGAVYSRTTTWVFRAGPVVGLASVILATALVPFGSSRALLAFPGDLLLFAYLLALARFFTVIAALDTGSSFEGMGASREVTFSTLAEPALLLALAAVARQTGSVSLSAIVSGVGYPLITTTGISGRCFLTARMRYIPSRSGIFTSISKMSNMLFLITFNA